jgi:hypothetical protein
MAGTAVPGIRATLDQLGITTLVGCARRGDLTMPTSLTTAYDNFDSVSSSSPNDTAALTTAANAVVAAYKALDRDGLITGNVQPALASTLSAFTTDVQTIGAYAFTTDVPVGVVSASSTVQQAYVRVYNFGPRYASIRACWRVLVSTAPVLDPLGIDSPLAEVQNLPAVAPNWFTAAGGGDDWPWKSSVLRIKLAWLVTNGGQLWCPTVSQLNTNYLTYYPHAA